MDSRLGEGDIFSALALGPAYFFGACAMIALIIIGFQALKVGKQAVSERRAEPSAVTGNTREAAVRQ